MLKEPPLIYVESLYNSRIATEPEEWDEGPTEALNAIAITSQKNSDTPIERLSLISQNKRFRRRTPFSSSMN